MTVLKNIQKTIDSISADYYPEGENPKGFMKIRLSDGEIIEHENVSSLSAPHVLFELRRLSKLIIHQKKKQLYGIRNHQSEMAGGFLMLIYCVFSLYLI